MPAGPGDLRCQRGRQTGILPGPRLGADAGHGTVQPGRTPAALSRMAGSDGQLVVDQAVQMLANRVGVLMGRRGKGTDRAGLRLVDQDVQEAGSGAREASPAPARASGR